MRKRTKRKMWNLIDPIQHGIVGASITPRETLDKLRFLEYSALEQRKKAAQKLNGYRKDFESLLKS